MQSCCDGHAGRFMAAYLGVTAVDRVFPENIGGKEKAW
jgi:hypothetical protein